MRKDVLQNQNLILIAISTLAKGGEPININRVSKLTNLDWKTVKRYFINGFYLKGEN
ncbi:MAG: hypothetical protein ACQERD_00945 [Campylobacterota bacterium]